MTADGRSKMPSFGVRLGGRRTVCQKLCDSSHNGQVGRNASFHFVVWAIWEGSPSPVIKDDERSGEKDGTQT